MSILSEMAKPLPPTLRERNRYLTFSLSCDAKVGRKEAVDSIWSSLLNMYGEVGASKTSMWVMDYDPNTKKGIVKVNHKSVETLRSSMTVVKEIGGRRARIDVLRSSGTLKKARELL